jgi:predicted flap endonuclease-1-like 5' DNA nuclease
MTTTLIASLFCMDNFFPILAGLLGAAACGWFLKGFLKSGGSDDTDLKAKLDKASADLQSEKERNAKLTAENKKKNSNRNDSAMALGTAAAAVVGVSVSEHEQLKNKLKNIQGEAKTALEAKTTLEAELQAAKNRAAEANALNSEVETQKTRIEGLARALDASKADAEKYKSEFEFANSERSKLSTQIASSDLGTLKKQIEKLEADLNASRLSNSLLQSENTNLKNGPKTLGANMDIKAAAPKADDTEKLKTLEAELVSLKHSNARLQKESETNKLAINAAVNEANSKTGTEITDLRRKLKVTEAELLNAKTENTKLASFTSTSNVVVNAPAAPVAEVKEATPAPVATPVVHHEIKKDDLTKIEGIGPKIAEMIQAKGIHTFCDLADASTSELQSILDEGGPAYRIANPGTWAEQAGLLCAGKIEEFNALCLELDGGVRVSKTEVTEEAAPVEAETIAVVAEAAPVEAEVVNNDAHNEAMEAAKANPSDLKVLEGVGPVLERVLNEGGIYTYAQLAAASVSSLKAILEASGDILHQPDTWPEQASLLRDGKMDAFHALCDDLKGGLRM